MCFAGALGKLELPARRAEFQARQLACLISSVSGEFSFTVSPSSAYRIFVVLLGKCTVRTGLAEPKTACRRVKTLLNQSTATRSRLRYPGLDPSTDGRLRKTSSVHHALCLLRRSLKLHLESSQFIVPSRKKIKCACVRVCRSSAYVFQSFSLTDKTVIHVVPRGPPSCTRKDVVNRRFVWNLSKKLTGPLCNYPFKPGNQNCSLWDQPLSCNSLPLSLELASMWVTVN